MHESVEEYFAYRKIEALHRAWYYFCYLKNIPMTIEDFERQEDHKRQYRTLINNRA